MLKCFFVNYNFTPTWILEDKLDYIIYDRSDDGENHLADFDQGRIIKRENLGNVDYDKLSFLVDNYDTLPEVFLFAKTNLFKYIEQEAFAKLKDVTDFTPLLSNNHSAYSDRYGKVCFYHEGIYWERNDSWYVNQMTSNLNSYAEFAQKFRLPNPPYLPFAPGGNYILTRERVHRYSKDFYDELRKSLNYCQLPAEAHMIERTYYTLWK